MTRFVESISASLMDKSKCYGAFFKRSLAQSWAFAVLNGTLCCDARGFVMGTWSECLSLTWGTELAVHSPATGLAKSHP